MSHIGFRTFPYGVLGQVWYLIVSIPNLCLHPYFVSIEMQSAKYKIIRKVFNIVK